MIAGTVGLARWVHRYRWPRAPSELDAAGDGFGCTAGGGSRFPRALT